MRFFDFVMTAFIAAMAVGCGAADTSGSRSGVEGEELVFDSGIVIPPGEGDTGRDASVPTDTPDSGGVMSGQDAGVAASGDDAGTPDTGDAGLCPCDASPHRRRGHRHAAWWDERDDENARRRCAGDAGAPTTAPDGGLCACKDHRDRW